MIGGHNKTILISVPVFSDIRDVHHSHYTRCTLIMILELLDIVYSDIGDATISADIGGITIFETLTILHTPVSEAYPSSLRLLCERTQAAAAWALRLLGRWRRGRRAAWHGFQVWGWPVSGWVRSLY
jgi:hypothetical protein